MGNSADNKPDCLQILPCFFLCRIYNVRHSNIAALFALADCQNNPALGVDGFSLRRTLPDNLFDLYFLIIFIFYTGICPHKVYNFFCCFFLCQFFHIRHFLRSQSSADFNADFPVNRHFCAFHCGLIADFACIVILALFLPLLYQFNSQSLRFFCRGRKRFAQQGRHFDLLVRSSKAAKAPAAAECAHTHKGNHTNQHQRSDNSRNNDLFLCTAIGFAVIILLQTWIFAHLFRTFACAQRLSLHIFPFILVLFCQAQLFAIFLKADKRHVKLPRLFCLLLPLMRADIFQFFLVCRLRLFHSLHQPYRLRAPVLGFSLCCLCRAELCRRFCPLGHPDSCTIRT